MVDDVQDFRRLEKALSGIGIDENGRKWLFEIIGGILHLGNVEFDENTDDSRGGTRISQKSDRALQLSSSLLGLDPVQLRTGLVSRMMQPTKGGVKGTLIM